MSVKKAQITLGSPQSELYLSFAGGPCEGRVGLTLAKHTILLGRGEDCDIVLEGETVSRQHCTIIRCGTAFFLLDSSRNGTFVNGQRVSQVQLQDNDQIRIGKNVLVVKLVSGTATRELRSRTTVPAPVMPFINIKPHIVVKGLEEGVTQPFSEERITIGRREDNHLVLEADNISRQHAAIERRNEQYFVCDLGSANGTYLNDRRIESAPLRDGDRIRLGNYLLTVSLREQDCILNFKKLTGC